MEQVFKKYDSSGDGRLDFKEFSVMFNTKTDKGGKGQSVEGVGTNEPPARGGKSVSQNP